MRRIQKRQLAIYGAGSVRKLLPELAWLPSTVTNSLDMKVSRGGSTHSTQEELRSLMILCLASNMQSVFNIVAPTTTQSTPSEELAKKHFPNAKIKGLSGNQGFWTIEKTEKVLGWKHTETE